MEKNRILNHSLTHPAYLMRRERKRLRFGTFYIATVFYCVYFHQHLTKETISVTTSAAYETNDKEAGK